MNSLNNITAFVAVATISLTGQVQADGHAVYSGFPVTVSGYTGDKTTSVSYGGQIARHMLHNGLKKMASKGDEAGMISYFNGGENLAILDPVSKDSFPIKQSMVDELSKGKTLSKKTYKGVISGWPGGMNGVEVLEFMIKKAGKTSNGLDESTGYNYTQLISKFAMGAVFYNQTCNNYLGDVKLSADAKPNDKPYKNGAAYTGKEHVWDEAFGYWGAAAHTLEMSAEDSYNVAKKKDLGAADHNGDGVVDLKSEMTMAHAYYASGFDKGGKSNYLKTITQAFLDGRKDISSANGEKLSFQQRNRIMKKADIICSNWEKVIAEAVFKYAGSVYADLEKMNIILEANGDTTKIFAKYAKHWGEAKGFALALEAGPNSLGEAGARINSLLGAGPWLPNLSQVTDIASDGSYVKDEAVSLQEYQLHMLKLQNLMVDKFGVVARSNDKLASIEDLASKLGGSNSSEND